MTLGCARNEVDSEELAARLAAGGFALARTPEQATVVVVNTCGFVTAAKKDSVDTLLAVADLKGSGGPRAVVAVGCLAERYGDELAAALPEADAVLGFDDYPALADRLREVLAGHPLPAPRPRDRRRLLPVTPVDRHRSRPADPAEAPAVGPDVPYRGRRRLAGGPVAPVKLASGCDRRCTFCAIPRFRGAYLSRPPDEVVSEVRWLVGQGAREVVLVSENSTSYGKDLADLRALEGLLPRLAAVPGLHRVRVSYLQPAELRPTLVDALTGTPGVAAYFDLSFQHASASVLRRMRRFGDAERFLDLLAAIRARAPHAGARSNVIVGFPGETEADLRRLEQFLTEARLDAVGVFGYSDEDGTEAAGYAGKHPPEVIRDRTERVTRLVEELTAQRAEDRVGEPVEVLVEAVRGGRAEGRAAHQGPDVDGVTVLTGPGVRRLRSGDLVSARVDASSGVDLRARLAAR